MPLVTPFTDDGSAVSEIRLARLIRWHQEQGCDGFAIGTEAGEFAALSLAERKQVTSWVMRDAKVPLYVHCTSQTTAMAIDLCQDANDSGAIGALVMPPLCGQLTRPEAVNFVTAVRRYSNLPVGFIDPSGQFSDVSAEVQVTGGKGPVMLSEAGLEEYAVTPHGCSVEFSTGSGMCHFIGLFGADRARAMIANWAAFKPVLQGALKLSGPIRVGKFVMEQAGIEMGPPRGPFSTLASPAVEIVQGLLK